VFPLVPQAGTPALKAWPELATTDRTQVEDWWTGGEYSGYGVGIACGPGSGIWVLDIDVKHGVNGFDTLRRLCSRHEYDPEDFTRTMGVATPSGGAHLYFRWTEGVRNSTGANNRLGPGLDVRAERGLVRAPGWDGYQVIPRGPEGIRRVGITEAPAWLVELTRKRPVPLTEPGDRYDPEWSAWRDRRALAQLGRAPEGGRNDMLNKVSYQLGISGQMTKDDAWAQVWAVMARIGGGDEARERRTFESGWNAGQAAMGQT
jgi:hypothetical protein